MRKIPLIVLGVLAATSVFAARFEDLTVTDLRVEGNLVTVGPINSSGTVTQESVVVKNGLTVNTNVTVGALVQAADVTATDDMVVGDDLTVTGDIGINSGSTISGQATSGTSKYNLSIVPVGSVAGFAGRVDGVHIGSEVNANCTTGQMVGAYVSVGRPAGANAAAAYPGGAPDTGFRSVCINKATNNATTYGIMGAFVKAKNYTTAVVKSVIGLRVEAINDGTDTAGESAVIELSTDSSTVDYGIDMDEMATPALGEIRFSNGAKLMVNTTNMLFITADGSGTNTFVQVAP